MTAETVHGSAVVVAEPPELETAELGRGPKTVSFRAAPDQAVPEGRGAMLCSMWNPNLLRRQGLTNRRGNESLCDEHVVEFFLV